MKKEIEVHIPAQEAKVTTRTVTQCDFCDKEAKYRCASCHRDLCQLRLDTKVRHAHEDPDESGDYPDRYCPICYDLKYQKLRGDYKQIWENAYAMEEALDEAVKKISAATDPRKYVSGKDELSD